MIDLHPDQKWVSPLSGRVLVVLEVNGSDVRWCYLDDPEDEGWDEARVFTDVFVLVR